MQFNETLQRTLLHLSTLNDNLNNEVTAMKEEISNFKYQMNRLTLDNSLLQEEIERLKEQNRKLQEQIQV